MYRFIITYVVLDQSLILLFEYYRPNTAYIGTIYSFQGKLPTIIFLISILKFKREVLEFNFPPAVFLVKPTIYLAKSLVIFSWANPTFSSLKKDKCIHNI